MQLQPKIRLNNTKIRIICQGKQIFKKEMLSFLYSSSKMQIFQFINKTIKSYFRTKIFYISFCVHPVRVVIDVIKCVQEIITLL